MTPSYTTKLLATGCVLFPSLIQPVNNVSHNQVSPQSDGYYRNRYEVADYYDSTHCYSLRSLAESYDVQATFDDFARRLLRDTVDMEPEIAQMISDSFWDLV